MPPKKKVKKVPEKITCQNPECVKLKKEQSSINFYNTNSPMMPKYPICKECLKKIVDIKNIQSVYKILKDMDIIFVKNVWDGVVSRTPDNALGNYIRQMNSLSQYRGLGWSNSIFENKDDNVYSSQDETLNYSSDWMGNYNKTDLDYLEEYLKSLKKDFKIVTRNHLDYAKKIAKASLAMDRAYEEMLNGGSESKYKMMKEIFDSLSKSAQFSESERGINDVSLGCFGVVFDKVEKNRYVPQHQPHDKDMYDNLLEQFSNINKSL